MKTKSTSLVLLIFFLWSCSPDKNTNESKFILKGGLMDQDTGIIVLRYAPESTWKFDTTNIRNGRFRFQGEISEPLRATLLKGNDEAEFYIEPGEISITLIEGKFADFKISGSKTQTEEEILNEMVKPVNEKLDLWRQKRNILSDSLKKSEDA